MTQKPEPSRPQTSGKNNGEHVPVAVAKIASKGTVIAASITALAGLIGVVITVTAGNSLGTRAPDVKPTQLTQPAPASPLPTSPALGSPLSTLPSPTQDPASTAGAPSDLDNVATDPTKITVATMLPQQYEDDGIVFERTSGWVQHCPAGNEAADVGDMLRNYGCTSEVVGTYLDSSARIQVAVWVIPMPDVAAAAAIFNVRTQSGTPSDWGILCPGSGVGSQVCREQWRSATSYGRIAYCHRYLMHASALYVDLRSDSAVLPALTTATTAATLSIGAQYIPGADC